MKKSLSLLLLAFSLNAFSQPKAYLFENDDQYTGGWFKQVSNDGRYVAGSNAASSAVFLLDTKTGEIKKITGPASYVSVSDVSNNGIIVGTFQDPEAIKTHKDGTTETCIIPGIYKDGAWIAVERGTELNGGLSYDGGIKSISGNGKLMGGYLPYNNSIIKYEPVIWGEDGKIIQRLPFYESSQGAAIWSMSDDGKVACGWYDGSMYGDIIIWKNGERVDTGNYSGQGMIVSANGKFVGGSCGKGMLRPTNKPFIWSEEEGLTIIQDVPEGIYYGYVQGISNDGKTAVGYVGLDADMTAGRHPFIIKDGVYHDFDTWMKENYNITGPYGASFWAISAMSADGNVICGLGYYDGARAPWVVVLDEAQIGVGINSTKAQELDVNIAFEPATKNLKITGEYNSINLYNNTGACVLTNNEGAETLNASNLANGIYIAKVMKDNTSRSIKVVISH